MPHYFFNIQGWQGRDVFDETGTELSDARELRIHMMAAAAATVEDHAAKAGFWGMEVLNERGEIVATMDFSVETRKA